MCDQTQRNPDLVPVAASDYVPNFFKKPLALGGASTDEYTASNVEVVYSPLNSLVIACRVATPRTPGWLSVEITRVKAFGEPAVDRSEQFARLLRLPLVARYVNASRCCILAQTTP